MVNVHQNAMDFGFLEALSKNFEQISQEKERERERERERESQNFKIMLMLC